MTSDANWDKAMKYGRTTVQQARLRGMDMQAVSSALIVEGLMLAFPGALGATPTEAQLKACALAKEFTEFVGKRLIEELRLAP